MVSINQTSTNPYFNIATEEYLLKNFSEDVFMLYVNQPSIIIGKHQNTFAEINYRLAKHKGVSIVRRLSGGGAVYHDEGNLNFTFIKTSNDGKLVDFKGFTKPIVDLLQSLGVDARFEGHNSLYVKGKKFSGNAEHVFKNRVMHHGTLLFNTDMQTLAELLYVSTSRFIDNAVKSVRAKTTNLSQHLPASITIETLKKLIFEYLQLKDSSIKQYSLSPWDKQQINNLVENKYATWEWNFGYSPSYSFSRDLSINSQTTTINTKVEKGQITNLTIQGEGLCNFEKELIESLLLGKPHKEDEIEKHLGKLAISKEVQKNILQALF